MNHVVMFSGGVGSWMAAKRVAERHGTENLWLLFTDTLMEDQDLYRFLVEGAANIYRCGGLLDGLVQLAASTSPREARNRLTPLLAPIMPRLVWLADGRTPWEVFNQHRFLGNTRVDLCSRILKREIADKWVAGRFEPDEVTVHVGIDWTEEHRFTRLRERKLPYRYEAPLCDKPYFDKPDMLVALNREGIKAPRLYGMGFAHNNCGGFCVKAGQGHFALLLRAMPERYREHEAREEAIRETLGDVAIMRDRSGGESTPLPMAQLRKRIEEGQQIDVFEIGGCGCFTDTDAA